MALLQFNHITKSFSGVEVLRGVSFGVARGKVTALMGENGAGKSTLMKILGGVLTDYGGEIILEGAPVKFQHVRDAEQAGIVMIHQELNIVPDLTIGENIFLGKEPANALGFINYRQLFDRADQLLKEFEFPYRADQPIRNIGLGWQQLVEIARALHLNSRIIIMDEPTSSLTESEKDLLFKKIRLLKEMGKTIIYISHRMGEVFEIADEVVVLRDGSKVGQSPVSDLTRNQLVALMIGKELAQQNFQPTQTGNDVVLKIEDLQLSIGKKILLRDISFQLRQGDILGLAGLLGAGRTCLLKFLYGAIPRARYTGTIFWQNRAYRPASIAKAQQKGIIYLSEDRKAEGIFSWQNIRLNTSISFLNQVTTAGFIRTGPELVAIDQKLGRLNTHYAGLHQLINRLSGGNQQKVLLARLLLVGPRLMLLDEPTRGIDVGAKEEIYTLIQALSEQGFTFIVASSEIPELQRLCNQILVLSGGYQTAFVPTGQTDARQLLQYAFEKA